MSVTIKPSRIVSFNVIVALDIFFYEKPSGLVPYHLEYNPGSSPVAAVGMQNALWYNDKFA